MFKAYPYLHLVSYLSRIFGFFSINTIHASFRLQSVYLFNYILNYSSSIHFENDVIEIFIKKSNSLNAQNELHVPLSFAAQCIYFFMLLDVATRRSLPWKIQDFNETWHIMGAKKKEDSADVENSKAAKCKIAGDAYHMNCNAVIIIIMFVVTIIARSLSNGAFPYFLSTLSFCSKTHNGCRQLITHFK